MVSRCYERTIHRWISHRLVEMPATYSSFLSCADTKSSWIPRVRFIRFNEDICVPLRCPLPASIDEQKESKKIWMLITSNLGDARIKKRLYLSIRCLHKEKTQIIALNSFCQVVVVWDIDAFEKIQRDDLECLQILCTKNESRKKEEGIKYFFLGSLFLAKLNFSNIFLIG